MSIAGIHSNRGDGYQTYVAFDWALKVLSDPNFEWIEIDSVTYSVDDVVVGKADGTKICCQCKKNQVDFKAWSISGLADELDKASDLLAKNQDIEVCFYSRSPFGELGKLREHSATQANEKNYLASLGIKNQKINANLSTQLITIAPDLSTYDFLCRTTFETSPELERMQELLLERLGYMASNPEIAFNALWICLDKLGGRIEGNNLSASARHRITKDELKEILHQSGAILVPIMKLEEVRKSFSNTSAIGRTWRRDIAGQRIDAPVLDNLLTAVDAKHRSILLTGLPGSGKTCVMLTLQEVLEERAQNCTDMVPLFIQSREFADLATTQDRHAQGLPVQWVEKAARMAEETHVIIVIDSLDVLSISREHSALTYFLAQVDRLLLIPNITVITACRDFDRHYDRRIAERQWDCELSCAALDWEIEIVPLLKKISIDTTTIDVVTRELIRNPRELALFVELAQREGSFNVVTSQALAQRYLDIIVRADAALGETAMQAIEAVADEMLKSRSLVIPLQRFSATQDIQRALCSLNVLQETQDGKLIFGHQTLLDILVISGAIRQGVTLNEFIQCLPPVPFVRPSIRSFIAQLATGKRSEFRKQLRAVLTGSAAFHVRRLVAESFAEQIPQDGDWPLIRDLRNKHREVFQVIYTYAVVVDWHYFWLKHLLPVLIVAQDAEGLTAHVHRVSLWKNDDAPGVLQFWKETLSMDWVESKEIAHRLAIYLPEINAENLALVAPLLEQLLCMPRQEHDFLGRTIARCVTEGVMEDTWLWRYVAGDINDEDVVKYQFDNKLHCQPHEFGDKIDNFFYQQIEQSTTFLDLALESIEQWSMTKSSRYGYTSKGYRSEFLNKTSYEEVHGRHDKRYVDSENVLMGAIEAAILNHGQAHSNWWKCNRERLCFNHEGALRYFAVLVCIAAPQANIDLVQRMLCDKDLLKSDLSYELGSLIQATFIYLDPLSQDAVMACILTVWEENIEDEQHRFWISKRQAELTATIPCFLRSSEVQAILDTYEKEKGVLIRQPVIESMIGTFSAPFSFEVFLSSSNSGVLRLLTHYSGQGRDFGDFRAGGEEEVGWQLREAASRHPIRFLRLLSTHWVGISERFCDQIMDGAATHLKYRYGNLQTNVSWAPVDEPDASALANQILDELEKHSIHWYHNDTASDALQACAHVIQETKNAARLVFLTIGFASSREKIFINEDSSNLLSEGLSMAGGKAAEALMILANILQENSTQFPELLLPTLRRFAGHEHPAIRALILRRLPYLQSQNPVLGWDLFERAMQDSNGLWKAAESCLYYAYHSHFEKVAPVLELIHRDGSEEDMETWGRISALSALTNRIDFVTWLEDLRSMNVTEAWQGAASVWMHTGNIKQHQDQCFAGIDAGLNVNGQHVGVIAQNMKKIFLENNPVVTIPIELIRLFFTALKSDSKNNYRAPHHFGKWLNLAAYHDPEYAITATEIYLDYAKHTRQSLYDHGENFAQLMTRLFAEAEEREESDQGEMLQRIVSIQDSLLSLGLDSISVWLKAAERP